MSGEPVTADAAPADDVAADQPTVWQRYDLLVVIVAVALLVGGILGYRSRITPQLVDFSQYGLSLSRPSAWLPPQPVKPPPSRLAIALGESPPARRATGALPYHVVYQSPRDPLIRLEIRIDRRPAYNNLAGALALARVARYGEVYWAAESDEETIRSRDWLRTRFQYAFKVGEADSPKVATGIEYATLNGGLVYVVTMHGSEQDAGRLRSLIAPTLAVDPNHPAATTNPPANKP